MTIKNILAGTLLFSTALFTVVTCSNSIEDKPSDKNEVLLNWNIPDGQEVEYETVMEEIGESKFELEFGGLFEKLADSNAKKEQADFFEKLKNIQSNTSFKTTLKNSEAFEEVIEIEMEALPQESDEDSEPSIFQSLLTGVVLRGSVNKDGTLHSFWVKSKQKNLISMFFELPKNAVSRGESWSLDQISLIGNDQNFICKEAIRENKVTLSDIVDRDGETIAIINYNIHEYVSGNFINSSFGLSPGKTTKTTMDFQYTAQGEFSVDRGRWVILTGIISGESSGIMNSNQKQKISLIEVK